jgi:tRNA G18 (ribose-2'-O)-methylase SpoU
MFNNVDSLNVSVATGILLFNIISKRKNKGFI